MEKRLVTWLTTLVVVIALVAALGAAFWRTAYRSGAGGNGHQHNHSSLICFGNKPVCS